MPILRHTCKPHPFQDALYGGRRVMNPLKPRTSTDVRYRCTVCGGTHEPRSQQPKPKVDRR